jgi:K+-sensing histidine kinase KdpD
MVAFALTTPQAAATLAATSVGFQIGLFGESVVNAVLILIFASILVATLVAESQIKHVEAPGRPERIEGERVLVEVLDMEAAHEALRIASEVAERDGGVVDAVLLRAPDGDLDAARSELDRLRGICLRLRLDAEPRLQLSADVHESSVLTAIGHDASLVVVAASEEDGWQYSSAQSPMGPPVRVTTSREPL